MAAVSVRRGGCTRYYEVDVGLRIPLEAHRVTERQLRFRLFETEVQAVLPLENRSIDVVRQAQQLAVHIVQLQLQKVAAALGRVHVLHHVNNTHQRELPARIERIKKNMVKCIKTIV